MTESRKKAKEAAEAAKRRAQKARAAAKIESEDETELDEEERLDKTKKSSKRSQVWPWENPGVESDDEVWIDGNIEQDQLGVHRLDITKGRKTSANGEHAMHEGITITSQTMHRKREPASQRYYKLACVAVVSFPRAWEARKSVKAKREKKSGREEGSRKGNDCYAG